MVSGNAEGDIALLRRGLGNMGWLLRWRRKRLLGLATMGSNALLQPQKSGSLIGPRVGAVVGADGDSVRYLFIRNHLGRNSRSRAQLFMDASVSISTQTESQ
jgi:hypothetical protein